jgi:hypothetical protein
LQFLQVHGLQRQPPVVQLQVQVAAVFSSFFSMIDSPSVHQRTNAIMTSVPWYGIKEKIFMYARDVPPGQIFYHGTKADLAAGDLIRPGFGSNFVERELKHIYFTATLDAATWGAELARGEGRGRIYMVEPTGPFEDDPNLTDKKFPGNMTASYRSLAPLRVTGEVEDWVGHSPERLQEMRDNLARRKAEGGAEIDE